MSKESIAAERAIAVVWRINSSVCLPKAGLVYREALGRRKTPPREFVSISERAIADIATLLHAVEVYLIGGAVSGVMRFFECIAQADHTENATA